jgi:hypothetical protein
MATFTTAAPTPASRKLRTPPGTTTVHGKNRTYTVAADATVMVEPGDAAILIAAGFKEVETETGATEGTDK